MRLEELLSQYRDDHEEGIRDSTYRCYGFVIRSFGRFLGREPAIDDLNRSTVNRWIDRRHLDCAWPTVKSQRRILLVLWKFAADLDLVEYPRKIRLPKKPERLIETWTVAEIAKLRDFAIESDGHLPNGIRRGTYFGALVSAGYDTALRLSDQLSLERNWILPQGDEGRLTISESKTGKVVRRVLSSSTMRLIEECMSDQPNRRLIWPLWSNRESFFLEFRKLVRASGIRYGTHKFLRRTAATVAEIAERGGGQSLLHHSSGDTTRESYLDQHQIAPIPMRVPPLPQTHA